MFFLHILLKKNTNPKILNLSEISLLLYISTKYTIYLKKVKQKHLLNNNIFVTLHFI